MKGKKFQYIEIKFFFIILWQKIREYANVSFLSSNFQQYFHPGYGNCFRFNNIWLNSTDPYAGERSASLSGPKFGLSLVLNVESQSYLEPITVQVCRERYLIQNCKK